MSDYIPHPDTEMHINQMPEDCLRKLFSQLPIETQFEAGNVCRLWRTVRDALFRTKKSLVITFDTDASSALIIADLNEERTAFLVAMFPSLTELTIFISNQTLFTDVHHVVHLLVQYRDQLVTLKLHLEKLSPSWKRYLTFNTDLLDAINTMSKLKQLSLCFQCHNNQTLSPFNLPILRQLDKFDFTSPVKDASIITLWLPHLDTRSTPMEISLDIGDSSVDHTLFDSITPKVASMFTHIKLNFQQFQRLSTHFTNLTTLKLNDYPAPYSSSVPVLMQTLANLKQLTNLFIYTGPFDVQPSPDDHLPQLPTVKQWHLTLFGRSSAFSHVQLFPWTANLSWLFPNLQDLSILLNNFYCCTDCGADKEKYVVFEKYCFPHQLRLIKQQQCAQLSKATMKYEDIINAIAFGTDYWSTQCTLEDIA